MTEYIDLDKKIVVVDTQGRKLETTVRHILDFNNGEYEADDVQLARHGRWGHRWVCSNMTGYVFACSCSECGKPTYRISTIEPMPPYCPNCGAKMEVNE